MPPSARLLQVLAATTLLFTLAYFSLVPTGTFPSFDGRPARWHHISTSSQSANMTLDVEILKELKVPASFSFQRHCLYANERHGVQRESLKSVQQPLLSEDEFTNITLDEKFVHNPDYDAILPPCSSAIEMDVPEFSSHAMKGASALMLGVATTMKRIDESLPTFSRWLSNTGTPLVVLLVDQSDLAKVDKEMQKVSTKAQALGIELIFEPYHNIFAADSEGLKNFGLATVLDKHRRDETQWFGVIDDDTFFLSLRRMLDNLEAFDNSKPWYIGALTEGHTRVSKEGFKAWGGAGIFISPPLMRTLAEAAVECAHLDKLFGDLLWRDCIQEVTSPTVHLTEMRGLHQQDLWGDISGWYEAGLSPMLTVHHWKSWHQYPVAIGHVVSDVAGSDTFLQRYLFTNNTVFTNGYSIATYPNGLPDLNLVELTFAEDVGVKRPPEQLEFHHSLGHTRPALPLGRDKVQWIFRHAVKTLDGTVRQFYTQNRGKNDELSVIEIDWQHA